MTREEAIEYLAEYFRIDPDENGEYDLSGYDWVAGCYCGGGVWLSLENVIEALFGY